MGKKILAFVLSSLMISSIGFASPLTDYSAGKGSIDLTWRNTQNSVSESGHSLDFGKKYNLDSTLTFGLGNKLAIQYKNFEPKSADFTAPNGNIGNWKIKSNEFNVLYKLDKNVSAYAGWVNGKVVESDVTSGQSGSISKNKLQVGVLASTAIAPKTTLWGSVAAGNDLTDYEVGVGYELSKGWEFNVDYRALDLKKIATNDDGQSLDTKAKGLGFGVTYKF